MPFGLTNTLVTFQSLMNELFCPHLRKFILVFFYDILAHSKSWKDHLIYLQIVLHILSTNSLFAKEEKCHFNILQVDCLGHQIFEQDVSVDPIKIQIMLDWPKPTIVKGMQGFLSLVGYYHNFIRHFEGITAPLTQLLNKDGFYWTETIEKAFKQIKERCNSRLLPTLCGGMWCKWNRSWCNSYLE